MSRILRIYITLPMFIMKDQRSENMSYKKGHERKSYFR